jgi:hypothetical protein
MIVSERVDSLFLGNTLNIFPQGGPINVFQSSSTSLYDISAWGTNQYVIVWTNNSDISGVIFDFDDVNGTNPQFFQVTNDGSTNTYGNPAVAGTSQFFVVAFQVQQPLLSNGENVCMCFIGVKWILMFFIAVFLFYT